MRKKNRDHPNKSIIKIDQNTEKSPGDLRRLAVTQIPVKTISHSWLGKLARDIIIIVAVAKKHSKSSDVLTF